ncbi:L,D-transpeptidase family protein [Gordonia sp. (in: high G+C Gram-positive bacteria)]|uniref:L,D-transpeptidase family protein n=1 Tax=unclassified Gordonia (in: high G+C Gram-positive bacteria) TaxID=2657482 RepID=UPI00262ED008|nr:L,D-transpeptidase family protein [Gordonia sp. (in: high G+C Gram-positive bacteria)]
MWQLGLLGMAVVVALVVAPGTANAAPTAPAAPATPDVQTMIENLLKSFLPGAGSPTTPAGDTSQMIVVSVPEASATKGTLTAFEKNANGQWEPVIGPVDAYVGDKGIGAPEDNVHRTPEGTFALGQAFGRQDNPGTKMPYKKVDDQDWWDANMKSPTYNRMVRQSQSPGADSENLYDMGPAYDYAVQIVHNPANTPGKASAIFLHVGSEPTWGCVAIDKESMVKILKWLDPAKNPKIAIGVNEKTPTDPATAPSLNDQSGSPLTGDALTGVLSQFTSVIPQLLGSATGS